MKNKKRCIICGRVFECPKSDKTVTCSKWCSKEYARIRATGRKFSEETRKKQSEKAKGRDMSELQKKATAAALESPKSGRFETNVNAKTWRLTSPDGKIYECRNLNLWVRENCSLFGKEATEHNIRNIQSGLRQAKRGVQASTYKGWMVEEMKAAPKKERKRKRRGKGNKHVDFSKYTDKDMEVLTNRQAQILQMRRKGMLPQEIGEKLGIKGESVSMSLNISIKKMEGTYEQEKENKRKYMNQYIKNMSPEQKERKKETTQRWQKEHPDRMKEHKKKYWEKYRNRKNEEKEEEQGKGES